jgi:hypothetical protein
MMPVDTHASLGRFQMQAHLPELSNNGGQLLLQRFLHPAAAEEDWHCGAQRALEARAESERSQGFVGVANPNRSHHGCR